MCVKFDDYVVITDKKGKMCPIVFCSGRNLYSYSSLEGLGMFLRTYEVKQEHLSEMFNLSDVWCSVKER